MLLAKFLLTAPLETDISARWRDAEPVIKCGSVAPPRTPCKPNIDVLRRQPSKMHPHGLALLVTLASSAMSMALPTGGSDTPTPTDCSSQRKIDAIQKEMKTISSHSPADAAAIPLAPLASRTFVVA